MQHFNTLKLIAGILAIVLISALQLPLLAQSNGVLIDYSGNTRDNSAVLDVRSSDQGVLVPRLTSGQRIAISAPADGLLVYDTDENLFYYYDTTLGWTPISITSGTVTDVTADNGLTSSGGTTPNIQLGGSLNQNTTVTQNGNDLTFDLNGTGSFQVNGNSGNALFVQEDGIVGINNNSPDATSVLDITSDSKGLLIPRLSFAQRNAIVSPANSLIIYNTTTRCLEIYTDGAWQSFYCSCPVLDPLQDITGPDPVCSGATVSFTVPGVTGAADYSWTVAGVAPGNITGNGSTTISFPAPNSNTFTIDVTASNACNNSSSSQSTIVNAYTSTPPTPTFNTTPTGICENGSYNYSIINGLGPNGTGAITYTWTITASGSASATLTANSETAVAGSPVSYTSTATAITIANLSAVGNITVSVVGNNTCGSSSTPASHVLSVDQFTTANAGSDQTVCATSATLAGNSPITGGGTWTLISGSGTITSSTNPNSTVTGLGLGANTFRWTLPNGSCSDSQDDVVITSDQLTTANAGSDQIVCATTATLAGNTPLTGNGTWTLISGAGTVASPNDPNSTVTGLGLGSNVFRWSLPNGVCADSQDDVSIERNDFTTANAGPNQTLCSTSTILAGNTPATGGGTWTLVSGTGTITSPTDPNSSVTGLGLGINIFRWTLLNGVCPDSQDDVSIERNDFTAADAGPDQTLCSTSATFAGNTPLTGSGTWSLVSGSGTVTSPNNPNSTVTGLGLGVNVFRWTLPNGVCADSQDDVIITSHQFTSSDAGVDQSVCATFATLAGNTPLTGGGTWTLISGTGTIASPTNPNSAVTGLSLGNNTFRWTLLNGVCADSQDDVIIQRNDFTAANAGPDQTLCSTTATLAANSPISGQGTWTVISGSGSFADANNPTTTVSGLTTGANVFRWTLPNGSCADSQDEVTITSQSFSSAPTGVTGTATICDGSSATLTVSGGSAGTGAVTQWYTGSCGGTLVGTGNSVTVSPSSNTTYYVRYSGTCNTTTCTSASVSVDYFTSATAGVDQTICSSSTTLSANTPTTGGGTWSVVSGSGTFGNANNPSTSVSGLSVGTNRFRWTLANGVCTDSQDDVIITRQTLSSAPTGATGTTTICSGGNTTLTVSGGSAGTGASAQWFTGSCGGTLIHTGNSVNVSPASTTTYYVRYSGTCNTTSCASVTVTVNTLSSAPTGASGTSTICSGGNTTLTVSGGSAGTGAAVQWFTGSCGSTLIHTGNSVNVSPTSTTTYYVRYSGTCNTTTCATVTVTVNSLSSAPTGITGTTSICEDESTTLTLTGGSAGTGATAQWFTGSCGGSSAGTGNSITVSPNSNTTYYVRYSGTCNTTSCTNTTVNVTQIPSDPGFGSNSWNFTAYNGGDISLNGTYKGYYSRSSLDYNSLNDWSSGSTPSAASGYQGCSVPVDYHNLRARRQGFTCGQYRLDIPNHDDRTIVYVNGTNIFDHNGCCDSHTGIWTGLLTSSSTVEVRHQEGVGGSHQSLDFTLISGNSSAPTGISGNTNITLGSSTTLTLTGGSAGAGATAYWYSGSCGGTLVGTGNSVTVTPSSTTTYYVRYQGSCNTTSCAAVTVTVSTSCTHSISLYDSYGDGWNGCYVDVTVNGTVVLDNITLGSGAGPGTYYFNAQTGDDIDVIFYPVDWADECYFTLRGPSFTLPPANFYPVYDYVWCYDSWYGWYICGYYYNNWDGVGNCN